MRFILRFIATILGIIGFIIGLLVDLGNSAVHDIVRATGGNASQTHGFIGFFLVVVGLIGAFIAVPFPATAAILMLVAAIGSFFVVGVPAVIAAIFFVVAAALAFFDRARSRAALQGS